MGTVFSGLRGWRGGKPATESLPVARLTYAELYSMRRGKAPRVVPQDHRWARVTYGVREWGVMLNTTPLPFGGCRRYMLCPACDSRRQDLYVSGVVLVCRVCLGLRYGSQHETVRDRMFRRVNTIRERLGWKGGIAQPNGEKPARMHRTTFKRLVDEHDRLANALLGDVGDWISRAEASLAGGRAYSTRDAARDNQAERRASGRSAISPNTVEPGGESRRTFAG